MSVPVQLRRLLSGGATPLLSANLAIGVNAVVTGIIIARLLGPEGRGAFALIVIWPALLAVIAEAGVGDAIVVLSARDEFSLAKIVGRASRIAAATTIASVAIGWYLLPRLLAEDQHEHLAAARCYLAFIPVTLWSTIANSAFLAQQKFRRVAVARYAASVAYVLGVVWLAWSTWLTPLSLAMLGVLVAAMPAMLGLKTLVTLETLRGVALARDLDQAFFGARLHASRLATNVATFTDRAIGARVLSVAHLGYYQVPVSLGFLVGFIPQAFAQVLLARVPRATVQERFTLVHRAYIQTTLLVTLAVAVLVPSIPLLVPLVYGAEFKPAIAPAMIFVGGGLFASTAMILQSAARAQDAPKIAVASELAAAITVLVMGVPLALAFGASGLAFSFSFGRFAALAVMVTSAPRYLKASTRSSFLPWSEAFRTRCDEQFALLRGRGYPAK